MTTLFRVQVKAIRPILFKYQDFCTILCLPKANVLVLHTPDQNIDSLSLMSSFLF